MTTKTEMSEEIRLYFASILAILFVLGAAAVAWGTLPPARRGVAEAPPPEVAPAVQEAPQTSAPAEGEEVAGQTAALLGDPAEGQSLFTGTCAACHGPNGEGIQGLGKDMTTSDFVAGLTDQELIEFIKVGRDPSDPLNTTGIGMPAKGGNPALSDEDLQNIVSYMRTIQK